MGPRTRRFVAAVGAIAFLAFYVSCVLATWWFYTRRGGLLHDIEHGGRTTPAMTPAQ